MMRPVRRCSSAPSRCPPRPAPRALRARSSESARLAVGLSAKPCRRARRAPGCRRAVRAGRRRQRHHVQPKVEVLAEIPGADGVGRTAVGRRNDADVHPRPTFPAPTGPTSPLGARGAPWPGPSPTCRRPPQREAFRRSRLQGTCRSACARRAVQRPPSRGRRLGLDEPSRDRRAVSPARTGPRP